MHRYYSDLAETELENSGDLIASAVEYIGDEYLDNTDLSEFRVTWIDSSGNVLFDSEEDASKLENHADRSEVIEAMEKGRGKSSRYSSTHMRTTINYAIKLSDGSIIRVSDDHVSYLARLASMRKQERDTASIRFLAVTCTWTVAVSPSITGETSIAPASKRFFRQVIKREGNNARNNRKSKPQKIQAAQNPGTSPATIEKNISAKAL